MNEKRFVYEEEPYHFPIKKRIRDTQNNETYIYDLRECCELLNEQQATIHSLKEEVRLLKPTNIEQYEQIVQLQEENEQLHLAIEDLLTHTSCEEVKKENSNLRQNIMIIKDLLSECDLFSDKATKHDIIAYKEMRQFDNKDAYCICTAIKKAIEKLKRCNDE